MHAFIVLGGDRGQRCGWQVQHDPTLLPRHFYQQLQKDDWCRFPRKATEVRFIFSYQMVYNQQAKMLLPHKYTQFASTIARGRKIVQNIFV